MVQGLDALIIALMATTTMTALILFLPAIIEIRKPKDKGPRLIIDEVSAVSVASNFQIEDIEEFKSNSPFVIRKRDNSVSFIPNIEGYFS